METLQRGQSARGKDNRSRGQLLDLVEADSSIEAQELQSSVLDSASVAVGSLVVVSRSSDDMQLLEHVKLAIFLGV